MGHPNYLEPKGEGDQSMSGKRGTPEDAYGQYAPQDPRDRVKAGLLEAQSPAVEGDAPSDRVKSWATA